MSNSNTSISWCDRTWNPVTGCSRVSPGCESCYAEAVSTRFKRTTLPWTARNAAENVVCHPGRLNDPLSWRKPSRIFVNSMSDLFHEQVPDEFIDRVFARMVITPRHTYQILTKRPERMREYIGRWESQQVRIEASRLRTEMVICRELCIDLKLIPHVNRYSDWKEEQMPDSDGFAPLWPPPNVWLGVSVEDQRRADERIPVLLETPADVRFLSCEPLLSGVSLRPWLSRLNWVIAGGESGPNFRPMDTDWARSLRDQCREAGVAFFFKQSAARKPGMGSLLDDVFHRDFPAAVPT